MSTLREDAESIVRSAIEAVLPDRAVRRALSGLSFPGRVFLISVGKAAWRMARAALEALERQPDGGVVISKYGHIPEPLPGLACFEAGHPVPDENSVRAARAALELTEGLEESDTVLFLLSGGGSALFEAPLIPLGELRDVTDQLVISPAEILRDGMGYSILSWDVFAYGEPDFYTYCKQYFDYYDGNGGGTISLVDCHQLEPLAEAFRSIIDAHRDALNYSTLSRTVQRYFYSSTPLTFFYDLRDLAAQLGASSDELSRLDSALAAAVPCHYETATFFDLSLDRCCGLSVYLPNPSRPVLNSYYKTLDWNKVVGLLD